MKVSKLCGLAVQPHRLCLLGLVALLSLGSVTPARAVLVTAYLYQMQFSGTFGKTVDLGTGNLPEETYPYQQILDGSFSGTFVYDSMASLDTSSGRFPYVSVNVSIFDNTGELAHTITTAPNNFLVTDSQLLLTFGSGSGGSILLEDLRLSLSGSFTRDIPPPPPELPGGWGLLNVGIAPPPPSQITAGTLGWGFLSTNGPDPFTNWSLPVVSSVITHTGTTSYLHEVPDTGATLALLASALFGCVYFRRQMNRSQSTG